MSHPRPVILLVFAIASLSTGGCGRSAAPTPSAPASQVVVATIPDVIRGNWLQVGRQDDGLRQTGQLVVGRQQLVLSVDGLPAGVLKAAQLDLDPASGAGSVQIEERALLLLPGTAVPTFADAPMGMSQVLRLRDPASGDSVDLWPAATVAVAMAMQRPAPTESAQPAPAKTVPTSEPTVAQAADEGQPAVEAAAGPTRAFLDEVQRVAPGLLGDAEWMVSLQKRPLLVADAWAHLAKRRRYTVLQVQLLARHHGDDRRAQIAWRQWQGFKNAYQRWVSTL